jgi:hypothetical protein
MEQYTRYSMLQLYTAWYSWVQYAKHGTVGYSRFQQGTTLYSMVQHGTIQYSMVKHGKAWESLVQNTQDTAWYSTVPHCKNGTAQYIMVQHGKHS